MLQCFMFQDIIHYGGKSFMHELKVARSQALTTREMAQIGSGNLGRYQGEPDHHQPSIYC